MPDNTLGGYTRHEKHDAADFANAEFARHPGESGVGMRKDAGDPNTWCVAYEDPGWRIGIRSDAEMADGGWSPVRECPDKDVHWRYDEAQETIQRLTKELDEALAGVRVLARENIECHERVAASCGHPNHGSRDHDCGPFLPAAESRPLTPDASKVTRVVVIGRYGSEFEKRGVYTNGARIEVQDDGRTLKVFPARHPEADSIQELIEEYTGPGGPDFADFLAERGVRVVGEERS